MKTISILTTLVAMLYAKSYKMETRSLGSLKTWLIKSNSYHKYLEERYLRVAQVPKNGSQPFIDYNDDFYLGNITLGTPGQTVSLLLDTGSSNLWVIDASCKTNTCNGHFRSASFKRRKFDPTKSSTCSTTNRTIFIQHNYGSCTGILVNDTVSFAGLTIKQQEFASALDVHGIFSAVPLDGIFGLGWPALAVDEVIPPMQNLLPNLDAPLFTVWMDKKLEQKTLGNIGAITFGAIDTTNCQSEVNYVPLSSEVYWQFLFEGFSIGSFLESQIGQATVDTGISWFGAPYHIVGAVVDQTGAQFSVMYGFYTVECSTMKTQPDLVFSINGVKYNVSSEDYVLDIGIGEGKCVLAFFEINSGGFGSSWIFGDPWFRSFCNIYDIGQKRIGLAKPLHSAI